eukprot:UN00515
MINFYGFDCNLTRTDSYDKFILNLRRFKILDFIQQYGDEYQYLAHSTALEADEKFVEITFLNIKKQRSNSKGMLKAKNALKICFQNLTVNFNPLTVLMLLP